MNISRYIPVLFIAAFGFSTTNAAEFLITPDNVAKKRAASSHIALDVVSDGDMRAFDFVIPIPKGAKVDTTNCLSALPKGFQGVCKFNENEIAGLVFSWGKDVLPKGIHAIGSIKISNGAIPKAGIKFNAVDTNAKAISSTTSVN